MSWIKEAKLTEELAASIFYKTFSDDIFNPLEYAEVSVALDYKL